MMPTFRPVRVVIADDHPFFRDGLRAALATRTEVEFVGEAADGRELLAVVASTNPDVVLTDLAMPRLDGVSAAQMLRERHPGVAVVILTMHKEDAALRDALLAGARGFLLKGAGRETVIRAILSVADGNAVYDEELTRKVTDLLTAATPARPFPDLTDREHEVLTLLATGLGNHEIAKRLTLSEKTIRNHVSAIYPKIQVHDRAAAIAKARDAGVGRRTFDSPHYETGAGSNNV
jgi:DNA-binding NarL/FixJ family response regulator